MIFSGRALGVGFPAAGRRDGSVLTQVALSRAHELILLGIEVEGFWELGILGRFLFFFSKEKTIGGGWHFFFPPQNPKSNWWALVGGIRRFGWMAKLTK